MKNEKYINRCIELSQKGLSLAAPNPSIGAVLVYNDEIIGEGFTSPYGGNHAEVNCIQSVKKNDKELISKATLYVSLEPCSHYGKTPPCSLLIIDSGIKKVVIGSLDPNPLVAGKGIELLKSKGISIEYNILKEECEFVNRRFYTFYQKKRPYIILKWAQTKNGYFSPLDNKQFWISNKYSKQLVHKWRTEEMAILVGTETVRIDNPQLNARLFKGKNPIRLVIDKDLKLSKDLHLFDKKQMTYVFNQLENNQLNNLEHVKLDFNKNFEEQLLNFLFNNEINSVIIEGGLKTINAFINKNLWDEARILTGNNEMKKGKNAPKLLGKIHKSITLDKDSITLLINTLNITK